MSRNKQNQPAKKQGSLLYGAAAVMLIAAAFILFGRRSDAVAHPAPRTEAEQLATAHPDDFGAYPEIKETYKMAAQIKSTLDGLFCYCHCKGGGHYSLLDCFRDEHGAGCDICLAEAQLAFRMKNEGRSLEEIRVAIDTQFAEAEGH